MLSPVWISGRGSRNRSMCLCHIFSLATQLKLKPCFLPVQRSSKACPAFFSLSSSYAYFMDPGMMIYVTLARCSIVHAVVILCCELAICGCWWPTSQARRYIYTKLFCDRAYESQGKGFASLVPRTSSFKLPSPTSRATLSPLPKRQVRIQWSIETVSLMVLKPVD